MDNVFLVGSDAVERGGRWMQSAAESMNSAASRIEFALERHARKMTELVERLEAMAVDPSKEPV